MCGAPTGGEGECGCGTQNEDPLPHSAQGVPLHKAPAVVCPSIILALLATTSLACAQREVGSLSFQPCGNATRVVECAQFAVSEQPHDSAGRQLSLRIVRLRQHASTPATTATFVLAGGPGAAATEMARGDLTVYESWAEHGDVVFMDQRGTGEGSPLRCAVGADFDAFAGIFPAAWLSRCRDDAARAADLAAYGTVNAAGDIEAARVALGYSQLNFVAASYGTRLAMEYMERFPGHVRAAVLDGVVPRELRATLHYAADAEAALQRRAELCHADARCRQFGDPVARFRSLMSRLAASPATAMVRTGPSSDRVQVTFGPDHLAYAVRGLLYGANAGELPRLLARADVTGDLADFAQIYTQRVLGVARTSSLGLHLSVLCAEDVAGLTPEQIEEASAAAVAGSYLVDQYVAACHRWRVSPARTDTVSPGLTQPLLLLSGALDPVTPPRWGEVVQARSTNARHVVFPAGGHTFAGDGVAECKARLVREFLRTARPDALDTACVPDS
jgi:pimeloyl-ACP methyl ester carboxylesterase